MAPEFERLTRLPELSRVLMVMSPVVVSEIFIDKSAYVWVTL